MVTFQHPEHYIVLILTTGLFSFCGFQLRSIHDEAVRRGEKSILFRIKRFRFTFFRLALLTTAGFLLVLLVGLLNILFEGLMPEFLDTAIVAALFLLCASIAGWFVWLIFFFREGPIQPQPIILPPFQG